MSFLRAGVLAVGLFVAACSGVVGAGGEAPLAAHDAAKADASSVPDWGPLEVANEAGAQDELQATPDLGNGPAVSGCVSCHTDKDRLYALAPPVPHEGEESGGG